MSIEIVAIGNEVLKGLIVNGNGAYLSRRCVEEGWEVSRQTTLSDDTEAMAKGLLEALKRARVVITTGGLGPTLDDNTEACARGLFTKGPKQIPNHVGTAPGLVFEERQKLLILLPGVPQEMEAMFEDVIPLLKNSLVSEKRHVEKLHFFMLREDDVDPLLRKLACESLEIGIYPSFGQLSIVIQGSSKAAVKAAAQQIGKAFAKSRMPEAKIEETIHLWMQKHRKTLAFAESCTGGFMAAQITAMAGASDYFLGSLVTYSNQMKQSLLNVKVATLKKHGAVSKETVGEMWIGLMEKTGADFGIAVSGIAGPTGGTLKKPVGTVWFAIGKKGKKPLIDVVQFKGPRQTVILRTTKRLFGLLWKFIQ